MAAILAGVGTQFPDLIDKPLAWSVAVLPTGRSLAHSLITASLVITLARTVSRRYNRSGYAVAFGIGYLSHLAADGLHPVIKGDFASLTYLTWPLLPLPVSDTDKSFLAHFLAFEFRPFTLLEFGLVALALIVWWYDDIPGVRGLQHLLQNERTVRE
ncbi:LexA-binding, inner membrane-associated putative hydrolase [Halogranum amylolyticum]|uniref:LexA-binding, inner membrane-associated putative hydrolase n=2 Tax=Halogranum amylolyticum TaxID=660520 RepID=A0A1H8WS33_9EURY|nr:LexA-binding, inner membrane-associated putative hydrolase [Halogranum amylolyticum]